MKVLVGISGGVDSAASAAILKENYDVSCVNLRLYDKDAICLENTENNIKDAKNIAKSLDVPFGVLDLSEDFGKYVTSPFIDAYLSGLTPNPCIFCNKHIKFGLMLKYAEDNGFDKIATGHYARIEHTGDEYFLKKASDISKDQSYVLYNLTQDILSKTVFPLGELTKPQARAIAEKYGLVSAHKKDSQDICFVPSGDYAGFIETALKKPYPAGKYIDEAGNILGDHKGMIRYTIGQRKGLGIALGAPRFVLSKNAADNTVVLGFEESLFSKFVSVSDINYINRVDDGETLFAKLRYSQKTEECIIHKTAEDKCVLEFNNPQRAASPGQSAVFYKDDYCVGGGIIVKGES